MKKIKKTPTPKHKSPIKKAHWIPFYSIGLLLLGTFFFLTQAQQQQQTVSKASGDCTVSSADLKMSSQENTMLDAINAYRAQNRIRPLAWNSGLKKPAKWLSNDMSTKNYLAHEDSLGRTTELRLGDCGLQPNIYRETIYAGTDPSPTVALNWWKSEAYHNDILLDGGLTQIGIALTGNHWAADFSSDVVPTAVVTDSVTGVPSPVCLGGACNVTPTIAPTDAMLPTAIIQPTDAQIPTDRPTVSGMPTVAPTSIPGGGGNRGGFLGLLLLLLGFFLSFFRQLF